MSVREPTALEKAILLLAFSKGYTGIENEPICGRTRISKMLFLASANKKLNKLVDNHIFRCYTYGPHSETIDLSLNYLVSMRLIKVISINPTCFNLTDDGVLHTIQLYKALSNDERNALFTLKFDYNSMDSSELLQYIYSSYPEYTQTPIVGIEPFDI